jgi:predicted Fe-S protein YdhL (DUF1289 family)
MNIKSPCIRKCHLKDDVCSGCYRTSKEIREWYRLSNEEKEAILIRIKNKERM